MRRKITVTERREAGSCFPALFSVSIICFAFFEKNLKKWLTKQEICGKITLLRNNVIL